MARWLGDSGHDVAVHYNTSDDGAEEIAAAVRAAGGQAATLQADLLDTGETEALLPRAAEALGGPITCLINNASIFEYDSIESATPESWHRHITSNLHAPFILTQALAAQAPGPITDARGEPQAQALIVNMVDQRLRKLTPHFMTYTLAKSALWTLTQTSARALAPRVRVNAIGPGPTLRGDAQSQEQFEAQRAATILERGSNPEDITGALAYLVSAPAVTGQFFCVDGGQHLAWKTPDVLGS